MTKYKFIPILILSIVFMSNHLNGQVTSSKTLYEKISKYDLSTVIFPDSICDDNNDKFIRPELLGYIGSNFQRFQIHFTTIVRSITNPYEYKITGKTKVRDNICSFTGTMTVSEATNDSSDLMEEIGFPTYTRGFITFLVQINEDKTHAGSGFIKGELTTDIYFDDKDSIHYQALMLVADGFSNNQFEGTWTSYQTGILKKCNWGDFRIPDSKDLDGGTADFYPMEKYLENGWRNYYNCMSDDDESKRKEAQRIEESVWWK